MAVRRPHKSITIRQAACVWSYFLLKNLHKIGRARLAIRDYFSVQDIGDITREQASNYINNEIRLNERTPVGICEMQNLERDWGIKE